MKTIKISLIRFIYVLSIALAISSCIKDEETEIPRTSAVYDVMVEGEWTSNSHPTEYPANAHFSPIIGMSHNSEVSLYNVGNIATRGIQVMAETGGRDPLNSEISTWISQKSAYELLNGTGLPKGTSSGKGALTITKDHPLASVVSMIAPSPDWFVGVKDITLYRNGTFVKDTTIWMESYDAGTDNGTSFTSVNEVSSPKQNISVIKDGPLGNGRSVTPAVATVRFVRRK